MFRFPAIVDNQVVHTLDHDPIRAVDGELIGELARFPSIRLGELERNFAGQFQRLQAMPIARIMKSLRVAAERFRRFRFDLQGERLDRSGYVRWVERSTGLPVPVLEREIEEVASMLEEMEAITSVQVPGALDDVFDRHAYLRDGHRIGYYSAATSLAVKIPGNVPTICIYWLIPLAQKRPIVLLPPSEDPLTHVALHAAIREADAELARCITILPCADRVLQSLFDLCDQVMAPESTLRSLGATTGIAVKMHCIHNGRSKLVLDGEPAPGHVTAAARRMMWNCGRTCTGLTSVIVRGDARRCASAIAQQVAGIDPTDGAPPGFELAKMRRHVAAAIDERIEAAVRRGQVEDVTSAVRGSSRVLIAGEAAYLLPTVLFVKDQRSDMFGLEFPFPFVTVREAQTAEEVVALARDSLIVSVVTGDAALVHALASERTIQKVFGGEHLERGYHPLDPHEGYLADFLNTKKAVLA